jgi:hypothetical protein
MAYILTADIGEIDSTVDFDRQKQRWQEYRNYLESIRGFLPRAAYEFATAPWHYDTADSRSLHDSWVEALRIYEPASGERHENRSIGIEVRLIGPYHDGHMILKYIEVKSYLLTGALGGREGSAHGDWLCDEVRLSERGNVLHEIEFDHGDRWLIESYDIEWTWSKFDPKPDEPLA